MYALTALALLVVVACTQATPTAGGGIGLVGIRGVGLGGIGGLGGHGGVLLRGRRSVIGGSILVPGGIGGIGLGGHSGVLIRGRRSILGGNILAGGLGLGLGVAPAGLVDVNAPSLVAKALGLEGSGIEGQWIPDINEQLHDDGSYRPGGEELGGKLRLIGR